MIEKSMPAGAVVLRGIRSPGPGGQNVNKLNTAIQMRVFVDRLTQLDVWSRTRLRQLAGNRLTRDGHLLIEAHEHRSQEANRREAWRRLEELIARARERPRARVATRPSRSQRARRVDSKKHRARVKEARQRPVDD